MVTLCSHLCKNGITDRVAIWVVGLDRLDCGPDPPMGMGNFEGEMGGPLYSIRDTAVTCEKMAEPIVMPFRLWARTGPRNHELDGVRIPMRRGSFGGKGRPLLSIWTFRRELCRNSCTNRFAIWFVPPVGRRKHKLNHICQMAPMCTVLIVFARWRQCTRRHCKNG